jgi:DNA-binding MarR family transcriptional regulator
MRLIVLGISKEVDFRLREHRLTLVQRRALMLLSERRVLTPGELSLALPMDSGSTTRMLDRLVAKRMCLRFADNTDRRVVRIAITELGCRAIEKSKGAVPAVLAEWFAGVAHDDLKTLEQALASLRDHVPARLICVFGCGGERDAGKRPQMAASAERLAGLVIVTDDNPRGENGDAIVADILAGFARSDSVVVQRDRAKAIARAIGEAGPNDIVLIAGKGHEPYQEIDGIRHPFDDTTVARQCLEERP